MIKIQQERNAHDLLETKILILKPYGKRNQRRKKLKTKQKD